MVTPQSYVALISEQAQTCAACLEGFYTLPSSAQLSAVCGGKAEDLGTVLYKMLQLLHVTTCVADGTLL